MTELNYVTSIQWNAMKTIKKNIKLFFGGSCFYFCTLINSINASEHIYTM